ILARLGVVRAARHRHTGDVRRNRRDILADGPRHQGLTRLTLGTLLTLRALLTSRALLTLRPDQARQPLLLGAFEAVLDGDFVGGGAVLTGSPSDTESIGEPVHERRHLAPGHRIVRAE